MGEASLDILALEKATDEVCLQHIDGLNCLTRKRCSVRRYVMVPKMHKSQHFDQQVSHLRSRLSTDCKYGIRFDGRCNTLFFLLSWRTCGLNSGLPCMHFLQQG
eukprot:4748227-Amphidinium_carterae.1